MTQSKTSNYDNLAMIKELSRIHKRIENDSTACYFCGVEHPSSKMVYIEDLDNNIAFDACDECAEWHGYGIEHEQPLDILKDKNRKLRRDGNSHTNQSKDKE